jgi:hypothetical protein
MNVGQEAVSARTYRLQRFLLNEGLMRVSSSAPVLHRSADVFHIKTQIETPESNTRGHNLIDSEPGSLGSGSRTSPASTTES